MPNETSALQAAVAQVVGELALAESKKDKFKDVSVERRGNKIIIPEAMSYGEARNWLTRQEEAESKTVKIYDEIPCFPLDGIVALMRALKERYGFAALADTPGFFGRTPPTLVQVPLADGGFETAPIGRIQPLTWEGGYIETIVPREPCLRISGEIKRKHETEVKEIISMARAMLKAESIYKGKAVKLDLEYLVDHNVPFDPLKHAPQFWDVKDVDEDMLILNKAVEFELASNIWLLIERTKECQNNNIPLKHGCLLMGPFGTGKTMTARVTASKCVRNEWTFIYLKQAGQLAAALKLAELYAPAVVFTEDIDEAVGCDRDEELNEILNTLDGVDTKDKPIITILTTNNPDLLSPAILRAGRIDTVISMGAPDAETAERFVRLYAVDDDGHCLLAPDIDLKPAGEVLAGFVPAFIAEAVQKSKRFAIHREGADIRGKIVTEDLVAAGQALQNHVKMVTGKKVETDDETVAKSIVNVFQAGLERGTRYKFNNP